MPSQYSNYKLSDGDFINAAKLNPILLSLDSRLNPLEALQISYQSVLASVTNEVLAEATNVVANISDQLAAITSLAWLTALSTTPLTLVQGSNQVLTIDADQAALFAPGPFAFVSRVVNATDYAIVQTVSYVRATGVWTFNTQVVQGNAGPHSDWQIAAIAGSTTAQMIMLAQGQALAAQVATEAAQTHADRIAADADAAVVLAAYQAVQSGPVTSVDGMTGVITGLEQVSKKGVVGGYAGLDSNAHVPTVQLPTGTSVIDPGSGKLEAVLPPQTVTSAAKNFGTADLYLETRRSNGGTAMADAFPVAGLTGLVNGARMVTNNVDSTASLTITAGSGTQINGASTAVIGPGRSVTWIYDATGGTPIWRSTLNGLNAMLSPNALGEIAAAGSTAQATARTNIGAASNTSLAAINSAAAFNFCAGVLF